MNDNNKMSEQDKLALQNLEVVCREFKGTLNEHQALQAALTHIRNRLISAPELLPLAKEAS